MKTNYRKMEWYRMLHTRSFWMVPVGIAVLLVLIDNISPLGQDVFVQLHLNSYRSAFIALFAFGGLAYAFSLREDDEHKFLQLMVLNGSVKNYARAKAECTFWGTVLAVLLGGIIYALAELTKKPFFDPESELTVSLCENNIFGWFALHGAPAVTFILWLTWIGLLAGLLAVISMLLAYVVTNRMFAIVVPTAGYYFLVKLVYRLGGSMEAVSLYNIYVSPVKIIGNAAISMIYGVALAGAVLWLLEEILFHLMMRQVRGERI